MANSPQYPLLPFSQLVFDSTRWFPYVYDIYKLSIRVGGVTKEEALTIIEQVLRNHPVFRSRIDFFGRQRESERGDVLHGQYYAIDVEKQDKSLVITIGLSRILGDDHSILILLEDIIRVYQGLEIEADDYWGYIEEVERHKSSQHYANSKLWLANEFADNSIPVRPTIDRRSLKRILPMKAGIYSENYSDLNGSIQCFSKKTLLPEDGFFSLCAVLAIAEYCGTDAAALTWAYKGRERPEEQRIFGSLHRDIPFQIKNLQSSIFNLKSNLICEARNQIRSGIAHSDYPYTLTAPYNKRWNYAVNVLRVSNVEEALQRMPIPYEIISLPSPRYAYALLDVEIHESVEQLNIVYRYSASHYKESSIHRFAALVRKYAEWLLEDEK